MVSGLKPRIVAYAIEKSDLSSIRKRYPKEKIIANTTLNAFVES